MEKNVAHSKSVLIWDKQKKEERYQVITSVDEEFDMMKFAEYKGIPSDQVAFADLDNREDLTNDFPDMNVQQIGLWNIFYDKTAKTYIDAFNLQLAA